MSGRAESILVVVVSALVVISVIAGLILVGPPSGERLRRLDSRRVADLRGLARAIDLHWTRNGRLPESLEEISGIRPPSVRTVDPETEQAYEYRVLGDKEYELCAEFDRARDEREGLLERDFWDHPSGRWCYQLEARQMNR